MFLIFYSLFILSDFNKVDILVHPFSLCLVVNIEHFSSEHWALFQCNDAMSKLIVHLSGSFILDSKIFDQVITVYYSF